MQAFVTGASGFVGSALLKFLNEQGVRVRALTRTTSQRGHLESLPIDWRVGDLRTGEGLEDALEGVDWVIHLAGATAALSEVEYHSHNARGSENLARAISRVWSRAQETGLRGPERVVCVSSLAAGGPAPSLARPRDESMPVQPVSGYGRSKLAGEQPFFELPESVKVSVLRPPIVYGPRDRGFYEIIQLVSKGWMPLFRNRLGGSEKYYGMIHVDDLVEMIHRCLTSSSAQSSKQVYYVSNNEVYRDVELLQEVSRALGRSARAIQIPVSLIAVWARLHQWAGTLRGRAYPLNADKLFEFQCDYWICSPSKARDHLEWKAKIPLDQGLADTVRWYRERGWLSPAPSR